MTTMQSEQQRVPVMTHREFTDLPVGTVVQYRHHTGMRRRKVGLNQWGSIEPYINTSGGTARDTWTDDRFAVGENEWHIIADREVAAAALDRLPVGTTIATHAQLRDLPDGTRLMWPQPGRDDHHFVKDGDRIRGIEGGTFDGDARVIEAWNATIFTIESYPDGAPVLDVLPVGTPMDTVQRVEALPVGSRIQGRDCDDRNSNFFEKYPDGRFRHTPDGTRFNAQTYEARNLAGTFWVLARYGTGEPVFQVGQVLDGEQMRQETVTPQLPVGSRIANSRGATFERYPNGWFRLLDDGTRGRSMTPNGSQYTVTRVGTAVNFGVVGQPMEKSVEALDALPVGSMVAWQFPQDRPLEFSGSGGWVKRETDWVQNTGGSLEGDAAAVLRSFGHRDMLLRHVGEASSTGTAPAVTPVPASTETLRQFKQRFRTIALGRMYRNGIGQNPVVTLMHRLQIEEEPMTPGIYIDPDHVSYDPSILVTGMVVERREGTARQAFGWNGATWVVLVGAPGSTFRDHGADTVAKVTYVPGVEAPEWTQQAVTEEDSRQVWEFKRTLRESGDRLSSEHSYCGEYGRAMSDAGVPEAHQFRR